MMLALLLPLLLGAVVLLALAALGPGASGKRRLVKRARALTDGRPTGPKGTAAPRLQRAGQSRLDTLAQRFVPRPAVLRARLAATGKPISIGQYAAVSGIIMAAVGALALMFGASPLFALLAAAADGLFLPHVAVSVLMARRRGKFLKVFAEAIGLIVRGLRAGLPVTETIAVVGQEIADPVGGEFRTVADQIRLGMPVEDAMWQAARRVGLPEFNFLVISLSVQRETGGNLAETLENLEQILRRRQQMRLKIRAMSSEATASALIIGSLPFVMAILMSVVNRDYLSVLFTQPLGRLMLGGGVASLVAGSLIMRQMVKFEI
ncbi:MAG: Flp pilus assembly protein TadB [Phenylobacterium sp.]|nr:Flp pilus assembly protein TadB [Phenylobacterium sp.]